MNLQKRVLYKQNIDQIDSFPAIVSKQKTTTVSQYWKTILNLLSFEVKLKEAEYNASFNPFWLFFILDFLYLK